MKSYCKRNCYVCASAKIEKIREGCRIKRRGLVLQKTRKEKLLKVVENIYIYKRIYNIYI